MSRRFGLSQYDGDLSVCLDLISCRGGKTSWYLGCGKDKYFTSRNFEGGVGFCS